MRKVNDRTIHRKKFYPWYYRPDLKLNLVPISFYTLEQAKYVLEKQFGPKCWKSLNVIKGSLALKNGWELGVNSFYQDGKYYQVKKRYIPPEFAHNKSRRRLYVKTRLKDDSNHHKKSLVNKIVKNTFLKTYGTR